MAASALGGSDASRPQLRLRRQLYPEVENLKRLLLVSRQGQQNSEALFQPGLRNSEALRGMSRAG